jgi:hypothetical protein
MSPEKSLDDHFFDWEGHVFGYGYGSGEPHTIPALKTFFAAIPESQYDYEVLEAAVNPTVAWLLINTLCHANIIEYGTSPRYGWLTTEGLALKAYIDARDAETLMSGLGRSEDYYGCYPDHCNCDAGPCHNPFWVNHTRV